MLLKELSTTSGCWLTVGNFSLRIKYNGADIQIILTKNFIQFLNFLRCGQKLDIITGIIINIINYFYVSTICS